MGIRRVVPDLHTEDISLARDFFVGLLGFEVAMEMDSLMTVVSPSNPTAQITLQGSSKPDLTIEVDDVDGVHAEAQRRGDEIVYPLTDEDWGVRRFFVRDPDGRVINVMAHVESAP